MTVRSVAFQSANESGKTEAGSYPGIRRPASSDKRSLYRSRTSGASRNNLTVLISKSSKSSALFLCRCCSYSETSRDRRPAFVDVLCFCRKLLSIFAAIFGSTDRRMHRTRRKLLVVDAEVANAVSRQTHRVILIVNSERARIARIQRLNVSLAECARTDCEKSKSVAYCRFPNLQSVCSRVCAFPRRLCS